MLLEAGLPKYLWAEAISHCVWIWNRTGTHALKGMTPLEAAMGKKPDLRNLHEWGCKVWVKIDGRKKLSPKGDEARFVGYDTASKGYRVYWPGKRRVSIERNVVFAEGGRPDAADATVQVEGEHRPHDAPNVPPAPRPDASSSSAPSTTSPAPTATSPAPSAADSRPPSPRNSDHGEELIEGEHPDVPVMPQDASGVPAPPDSIPVASQDAPVAAADAPDEETSTYEHQGRPRRNARPSEYVRRLERGEGIATGLPRSLFPTAGLAAGPGVVESSATQTEDEDDAGEEEGRAAFERAMAASMGADLKPRTFEEACRGKDWPKWEAAILEELAMINHFGTYTLVDRPPPGVNVVGSKLVFRTKRDAEGNIAKYKVRLVTQGFTQVPGLDYTDTFVPVSKLESLRVLLALAARENWEVDQMDVKNAYLNGELEEEIYMEQPPGFAKPGEEHKVCLLHKTIYGLNVKPLDLSRVS